MVGSHTKRRAKLSCDTSETKARVANEAFNDAMTRFKADLSKLPSAPGLL